MESSLSNLDLTEIERSAASPIPPVNTVSTESQNPTEQERQLAAKASTAYFNKKSYVEALAWLDNLVALRPNDPRVTGNYALLNFLVEGGGFNDLAKLQVDLKNTYSNVLAVQGEFEVGELPVLVFNLALIAFYQKNFAATKKLLEQIHQALSTLPATPTATTSTTTNPNHNINVFKSRHLFPLLISACLNANKPQQALRYLCEAESLTRHTEEESSFLPRSVLFRAHALVLLKQHKTFKRDMKSTGLSPELTTVYEFFRSNLEFLKGNHRKAAKLLSLAVQQQASENLTSRVVSFYENNLGCLHLLMSKPNLAVFYFEKALQQQSIHVNETKGQKVIPKNAALSIKQIEVIYNLGLALLHSGHPEQAFQSFSSCMPAMESNPSLWLHLAECCIMSTKKTFATDVRGLDPRNVHSNEKPSNPVLAAVGTGTHRKIILSSSPASNSTTEAETSSTLTLEYAAQCLKNALQFCGHPEIEEGSVITTSSSPRGNGNSSSANSSTQASPLKSTTTVNRNLLLRASILINSSYVALCLNNPILALDFSERLLEFNKNCILPGGYKTLAHIYAAQALLQLSRISDATSHLDPTNVQENSFTEIGDPGEDSSQRNQTSVAAARTLFKFNLIVAYTVRGEHDRAESLLEKLMEEDKLKDTFGINHQMISLQLYIQLAKGNVDRCCELAIKHCAIIQQN